MFTLDRYSGQIVFNDVMKQSDEWHVCLASEITTCNDYMGVSIPSVPKDEITGYPLEAPFVINGTSFVVKTYMAGHESYPEGTYKLILEGEGIVKLKTALGTNFYNSPGEYDVEVRDTSLVTPVLWILESSAFNPISSIKLVMPDYVDNYEEEIFYTPFLERMGDVSVIRMMNLQHMVNGNPLTSWNTRLTPAYHTQVSDKGVALEYLIAMANRIHKDIWLHIPQKATDDYIRNFSIMVRENLDSDLKVYIEYSNEIWNNGYSFPQGQDIADQGCALKINYGNSCYDDLDCGYDPWLSDCDRFPSRLLFWAKRMTEIFEIFEETFVGQEDRVVKVFAGMAGSTYTSQLVWNNLQIDYINNGVEDIPINPNGIMPDVFASAPYFGEVLRNVTWANEILSMTYDEYADYIRDYNLPYWIDIMKKNKDLADSFGLPYITYEGGQHFVDETPGRPVTEYFNEFNRHPRMSELYNQYLEGWYSISNNLMTHFNYVSPYNEFGNWGLIESLDQPLATSYKYNTVMEFAETYTTCREPDCSDGEIQSCYTGPSETGGVGICIAGTMTCNVGYWSSCEGQITPKTEACDDTFDNDCDGLVDCSDSDCIDDPVCQTGEIPEEGLIAYYPLDGNCIDESDYGNDCSYSGGTFVSGKKGQGYNLQQTDNTDYIYVENSALSSSISANGLSAAFWVNLDSACPKGATWRMFERAWGSFAATFPWAGGQNIQCQITGNDGVAIKTGLSPDISLNDWNHIACVYDNNIQQLIMYVNGASVSSVSTAGHDLSQLKGYNRWFGIGNSPINYGNNKYAINGTIDDFALWDRALTATEVNNMANGVAPVGVTCNSGSMIGDANGNGYIDEEDSQLISDIYQGYLQAPDNLCCVDVNNDGWVTPGDAYIVLKIYNGEIEPLGYCS